jgi:hypothetical protein
MEVDIEAAQGNSTYIEEYLPGYVDFSHFIASDNSLSIYRKFAVLGARNLLYLEAEIQLMEFQLKARDGEDKKIMEESADEAEKVRTENSMRSWEDLKLQAMDGDSKQAGKLRMIYKLRRLMKEYGTLNRRNEIATYRLKYG